MSLDERGSPRKARRAKRPLTEESRLTDLAGALGLGDTEDEFEEDAA